MENSYNSLSVAVEDLQKKGYTEDFNLVEEGIKSKSLKKEWKAGELDVIKFFYHFRRNIITFCTVVIY